MSSQSVHLPPGFHPSVTVGEMVTIGQALASRGFASTAIINIANELSLPVIKAGKAIKKNPGDAVAPGETIASRSGFLGIGEQKVVSSVRGTVVSYERKTGELTLRVADGKEDEETYPSPVAGKIVMCDNGKIVIDSDADGNAVTTGTGGEVTGEIVVLKHDQDTPVPVHTLTPDIIGKVVVGPSFDREGLVKLIAMGVSGIVARNLKEQDIAYFSERAGTLPLILVTEPEYQQLTKQNGKKIALDGVHKRVAVIQT